MNQKKNKSYHLNKFQFHKNVIKILYFCLIIIIFYFNNELLKASEQEKDSISAKKIEIFGIFINQKLHQ